MRPPAIWATARCAILPHDADLHADANRASVRAATRVTAEQTSHEQGAVKWVVSGDQSPAVCPVSEALSPLALRGSFPSTINLTYGRRLRRLHQHPACGGQGSGRREPFSKTAFQATDCFGSSTWIRQD
jgi:hypothetical protein